MCSRRRLVQLEFRDVQRIPGGNLVPCTVGKCHHKRTKFARRESRHDLGHDIRRRIGHGENMAVPHRFSSRSHPDFGAANSPVIQAPFNAEHAEDAEDELILRVLRVNPTHLHRFRGCNCRTDAFSRHIQPRSFPRSLQHSHCRPVCVRFKRTSARLPSPWFRHGQTCLPSCVSCHGLFTPFDPPSGHRPVVSSLERRSD